MLNIWKPFLDFPKEKTPFSKRLIPFRQNQLAVRFKMVLCKEELKNQSLRIALLLLGFPREVFSLLLFEVQIFLFSGDFFDKGVEMHHLHNDIFSSFESREFFLSSWYFGYDWIIFSIGKNFCVTTWKWRNGLSAVGLT